MFGREFDGTLAFQYPERVRGGSKKLEVKENE